MWNTEKHPAAPHTASAMLLTFLSCFFGLMPCDAVAAEAVPILGAGGLPLGAPSIQSPDYPIRPTGVAQMSFSDGFFEKRMAINRAVTIRHHYEQLRRHGYFNGFEYCAGKTKINQSAIFHDMETFRAVEAMAYAVAVLPDPWMERTMADMAALFAAAQSPNGYLHTWVQITKPESQWYHDGWCWTSNVARLIDAAAAHAGATGRRDFLEVARKSADLLVAKQADGKRLQVSNHCEVELALVKLYRLTGNRAYLDAADRMVAKMFTRLASQDESTAPGDAKPDLLFGDHAFGPPFLAKDEITGHVVASMYGYSGAVDVAQLCGGRKDLVDRLEGKWQSLVGRKLYLHGGVGVARTGECFGGDYELPNDDCFGECCSAMANILWQHRLFLASGESRYLDVLERCLYNNYLAGMSMSGDRFFYLNPMWTDGNRGFSHGNKERQPWEGCPCCIDNYVRFMGILPQFVYAARGDDLYVNLFAAGTATLPLTNGAVELKQETRYPWDGAVRLTVSPAGDQELALRIRIPGWVGGKPVPSDLYAYLESTPSSVAFQVNGQTVEATREGGFAVIRRVWNRGDVLAWTFPMPVRRVEAHEKVISCKGQVAVERGPIVYCVEGTDNGADVLRMGLPDDAIFSTEWKPDLLGGVNVIRSDRAAWNETPTSAATSPSGFTLIPYYAWNHRGVCPMTIWLPRQTAGSQPSR